MPMTQEERRADTRQRLLDAARDVVAERGVAGASVDAVAEAADRTSGALYAQFGSKEGLLVALLDVWRDAVAEVVGADFESESSLSRRLESLWTNFVDPPSEGGDAWVLLEHELWLYACRNPVVQELVADRYADARERLAGGLGRSSAVGALVIALLIGLEMQRRLDPDAVPDDVALAGLQALARLRLSE